MKNLMAMCICVLSVAAQAMPEDVDRFVKLDCSSKDQSVVFKGSYYKVNYSDTKASVNQYYITELNDEDILGLGTIKDKSEFTKSPTNKISLSLWRMKNKNKKDEQGYFLELPRLEADAIYSAEFFSGRYIITKTEDDQVVKSEQTVSCQVKRNKPERVALIIQALEAMDDVEDYTAPDLPSYEGELLGDAKAEFEEDQEVYEEFGVNVSELTSKSDPQQKFILISVGHDGGAFAYIYTTDGEYLTGRSDGESSNGSWSMWE